MEMMYEVIGRYDNADEAMRDANELLDIVTGEGYMIDKWWVPIGRTMTGECAHHIIKFEWHAKNGKLVEFHLGNESEAN